MRNAVMFHGSGETPSSFWYPSIKMFLESQGYEVWAPQLPEQTPGLPELRIQLPHVLENGVYGEDTVLIAHSAGCSLALRVLEKIGSRVKRAILVAGRSEPLGGYLNLSMQEGYDWDRIKRSVEEIYFINSDDDPWGCDHKQGEIMFRHLGGTLIIRHGEGHMGSNRFNQPYRDFPLLERLLTLP